MFFFSIEPWRGSTYLFDDHFSSELLIATVFSMTLEADGPSYHSESVPQILPARIKIAPFDFFARLTFLLAIIH
jgi:hypothetical protein